ncbi:MAG: phosphotransferase family protein [Rhodobiaceae bacterium]|nr:phosphotransferase family protein [Rhodobiaceae bacterium]MCC0057089.1 phosphotransferase family protein [Rhodobiaceae bacterium]
MTDIAALLQAALARQTSLSGNVENLQRLSGGATKATWAFDLVAADEGSRPLILQQTATPEASGAENAPSRATPKLTAAQDAEIMKLARSSGVPAPEVLLVLSAEDGLGEGYVTARVEGETLGKRIVSDDAFAPARRVMARQCGEILAAIHAVPLTGVSFLRELSPQDELEIYGGVIDNMGISSAALEYARRWVAENVPSRWSPALTHADFRTGNLIVDAHDGIRCVLDWEIARIGDPMQDLGVLCMRSWRFGGTQPVGGFGSRDDLYGAYENAGGRAVDPVQVRFWEAFSNLKWAISCIRRGLATNPDGTPQSVELAAIGRRIEEPLWDFLNLVDRAA